MTYNPEVNSGDQADSAYQDRKVAYIDSSLKTLILNCLQDIGYTKAEAQAVVLGHEKECLLTGKSAYASQVI